MKTGPLFNKIRETPEKIIVLQGGGDAGKTVTAEQVIATWSTEYRNLITTIAGQDVPNLKGGALRAFQRYIEKDEAIADWIVDYHKSERIYTFSTGSIIEFKSFADEQDARGGERDILFTNEANAFQYSVWWQLNRKTRWKSLIDYNPTSEFWVHEKLLPGPTQEKQFAGKVRRYIVDHRHNPFLSQEDHDAYENISDPDMFRVYARGYTGKMKGLIFGHFKKKAAQDIPQDYERVIWGIDYGYTNDPTAIVKIYCKGKERWCQEIAYEPGISAEQIKLLLIENGLGPTDVIYSERDQDMINQLTMLQLYVVPAIKTPGSVAAGISKTKEYYCYYTDTSPNFEKEIKVYKWITAEDIVTGKEVMTNIPMDAWNHLCDATRYAIYTDSFYTYT